MKRAAKIGFLGIFVINVGIYSVFGGYSHQKAAGVRIVVFANRVSHIRLIGSKKRKIIEKTNTKSYIIVPLLYNFGASLICCLFNGILRTSDEVSLSVLCD